MAIPVEIQTEMLTFSFATVKVHPVTLTFTIVKVLRVTAEIVYTHLFSNFTRHHLITHGYFITDNFSNSPYHSSVAADTLRN